MMAKYIRVWEGSAVETLETDQDITQMFHPDLVWIDVSKVKPLPEVGWLYDGEKFSPAPVEDE